jgi:hypothetical protein
VVVDVVAVPEGVGEADNVVVGVSVWRDDDDK